MWKPSGSSSIFLPCFSCSPPTLSTTLLLSSVTVALRPGSQEQLVCLPALLTTANLWQEATFTSLHTTHTTLKSALRVLPCSRDLMLQHWPCTSISSAPRCEFFFTFNKEATSWESLGYCCTPPLSQTWRVAYFFTFNSHWLIWTFCSSPTDQDL